MQRFIEVHPNL